MYCREEFSLEASFTIRGCDESPFTEHEEGPRLTKARLTLAYSGGLEGEAVLEEFKVHFGLRSSAMVGLVRFSGRIGDLTGSFVLHHNGTLRNGILSASQVVVPGSAAGGLKGLRGELKLRAPADSPDFPVRFNYYFA